MAEDGDSNAQALWERLKDRPIVPVPVASGAASMQAIGRPCILVGWSFKETTGAGAATVHLHDGRDNGGSLVYAIQLASNTDDHENGGDHGPLCRSGVFVEKVAGSTVGAIFVRW